MPSPILCQGRAELAASLAGANVEALKNEIRLAEQRAARWPRTTGSAGSVDSSSVLNDVLASSYQKLHRFQSKASHCKPRQDENVSAMAHVRSLADLRAHATPHVFEAFCEETLDEIDMARMAAMHTYGQAECHPSRPERPRP
ncbi:MULTISPECIES: hypothetical protein [unclassified Bradyrhizobium]